MQTNTLRGKKQLLIGFTLFSMFFGAGNLIFPPYLGAQAGTRLWLAFAGFAVSAIGLPIAGVVAVARAGGCPSWPSGCTPGLRRSSPFWYISPLGHASPSPARPAPRLRCWSRWQGKAPRCSGATPSCFLQWPFWWPSTRRS